MQEDGMHRVMKKLVATMLAAVTIAAPAAALAEDAGECTHYDQVHSNSTGGDYVGGTLFYETTASVARSDATITTTSTTSVTVGVPGTGASTSVTTTRTETGSTTTAQEPLGYYAMNDGSVWTINCASGEEKKISSGD
jgi:hypothetical protein